MGSGPFIETSPCVNVESAGLEFVQRSRPIILEQPRQRAIREDAPVCLAAWAVVRLVVRVANPLYGGFADWTRLAKSTVHSHARPKRGDFFRKVIPVLSSETVDPLDERFTRGGVKPLCLVFCQFVREGQRR